MAARHYLAFDLGAESGRGVIGAVGEKTMELTEIHRFPNGPVAVGDRLYWDTLRLFSEIKHAITEAVGRKVEPAGIGVSTWGIDFGLFDESGELVGLPHCYRDPQTDGVMDEVFKVVPKEEVFAETGIQFMGINALYHLYAFSRRAKERLAIAKTLLNTPDIFTYWLSGEMRSELSIASTTQLFRGKDRRWATGMLARLGLPTDIFAGTVEPGTLLGPLRKSVADECGAKAVPVVAVTGHDTAAAMAAVPYESEARGDCAAISSGTWSSVGVDVATQCTTEAALANNFTNEIGVGGFMFRKNMTGFWTLQECRRVWAIGGKELSHEELVKRAAKEKGFGPIIEPDFVEFLAPGDMPAKIADFCRRSRQAVPESIGAVTRTIFESMALKYRFLVDQIDEMLGRKTATVHLVGGGSRNELLCQMTANATGRRVVAGPAEATTMGNVMMQAVSTKQLASVAEGIEIIRASVRPKEYLPADRGRWDEHYGRFLKMRQGVTTAF